MHSCSRRIVISLLPLLVFCAVTVRAQEPGARPSLASPSGAAANTTSVTPPSDYTIGPEDQLSVVFFQNKDMSGDVVVRSDGKISLPLLNDIVAAGLTPEQLRARITVEAKRFMQEPTATVVVRQINSRKVFILGAIEKPGSYSLIAPTTVLQLIATASGLKEYADSRRITIMRNESGRPETFTFNYKDVIAQKNTSQDIRLKPGDIVVVP